MFSFSVFFRGGGGGRGGRGFRRRLLFCPAGVGFHCSVRLTGEECKGGGGGEGNKGGGGEVLVTVSSKTTTQLWLPLVYSLFVGMSRFTSDGLGKFMLQHCRMEDSYHNNRNNIPVLSKTPVVKGNWYSVTPRAAPSGSVE